MRSVLVAFSEAGRMVLVVCGVSQVISTAPHLLGKFLLTEEETQPLDQCN